jgi:hypothetical protein
MATYGIIGGGTCPQNIIEDGLKELGIEGNTFIIVGTKRPSTNEERVFDYLLENEASFQVVCLEESHCPKVLRDSAELVSIKLVPSEEVIRTLAKVNGILLVMWDEENEDKMTALVTKAFDADITIKELSNGLTPIALQDTKPTFSEQEFESMPSAIQKRNETPAVVEQVEEVVEVPERLQLVAPDGDCMITVVMPNGTVISTPATIEEVRVLLGLSGGS